tara:strand:- start:182 stop:1978 length:1797 start_codon:yes stop_codon:yes gene_type:complete
MVANAQGFSDTHDNQKSFGEANHAKDTGPYVATVKTVTDPLRMGRLGVNIPALTRTTSPSSNQIIWCQYLSPFYGAKSIAAVSKSDPFSYQTTQHSYGMWAVPPDIDTEVLVIFAKGDRTANTAFWIGCVQKPLVNQQVPGYGSSNNTEYNSSTNRERQRGRNAGDKGQTTYGTDFLPSGEKNQLRYAAAEVLATADKWKYPINDILADQLQSQGLVLDTARGTTSSSARRESPSKVFGISTPGAVRADSRTKNIGLENSPVKTDRNPGHSFVMDDGDVNGDNQLTRIRTASGHQILMHDTEGTVYIANGSGKAFIEMERDGTISVFSDAGMNLRSKQDFNIHSDININFHAKGSLNFTAEQNVNLNAEGYVHTMGEKGILNSSQKGSVRNFGRDGITSFTPGPQLHGAGGRISLAGTRIDLNSSGPSSSWGPGWLKPDHSNVGIKVTGGPGGLIDIDSETPLQGGKPNKVENKTTVSDFVTHEPYTRTSSTALKKTYINEAMAEIKLNNPDFSAQELQDIKTQLLKKSSISAVSNQLEKIVKLNDKVKLPLAKLTDLKNKAENLESTIKNMATGFIQGKITEYKTAAISAVRSFFRF